jgi:hypothetical protein
MTDKELLVLAAKAARIEGISFESVRRDWAWNPLDDDGDALRLAVTLRMNVHLDSNMVDVDPDGISWFSEAYGDDHYASTRRAIVRAAAEIGKLTK